MNKEMLTLLQTRRCVRSFTSEPVRQDDLDAILEAGTHAPTAMNLQSPLIVSIQDPKLLELARYVGLPDHKQDLYYGAQTIVLVFADRVNGSPAQDGSNVLMTMMYAAHALDVASCWIYREDAMLKNPEGKLLLQTLDLDDSKTIVGSLALGYSNEPAPALKPRKEDYIRKF